MAVKSVDKLLDIATYFDKTAGKKKDVHGNFVFSKSHPKVKDKKDHFPINNANHARNALARAGAFTSAPKWFKGTLTEFQNAIRRKVKKDYPGIEIAKKKKKAADIALQYNLVKDAIRKWDDDEPILPSLHTEELEPALFEVEEDCPDCDGSGYDLTNLTDEEIDRRDILGEDYPDCKMCGGEGTVPEDKDEELKEYVDICPVCGTDHQDPNNKCDYEECGYCGFDHGYEYEQAHKWHTEHPGEGYE